VPFVELYRNAARSAGHDPKTLAVSINSHRYVADTSAQAADEYYTGYSYMMGKIGRERGWPPPTRAHYEHELFGNQRFLIQMSVGTMPHEKVLHAIELFGTKIAPIVRAEIGRRLAA